MINYYIIYLLVVVLNLSSVAFNFVSPRHCPSNLKKSEVGKFRRRCRLARLYMTKVPLDHEPKMSSEIATTRRQCFEGASAFIAASIIAPHSSVSDSGEMMWLPKSELRNSSSRDSAGLEGGISTFSDSNSTYPDEFVAYLARFLLTYDSTCRRFFEGSIAQPKGSNVNDIFRSFAASVFIGLERYPGFEGSTALAKALLNRYAYGNSEDAVKRQLGILFTFLSANYQPIELIEIFTGVPAKASELVKVGPRIVSNRDQIGDWLTGSGVQRSQVQELQSSPIALLPYNTPIRYDAVSSSYKVDTPGECTAAKAVLRAQAPNKRQSLPTKERVLTPPDFALFALCGAIGCILTHTAVIPLDVVKTRLQTNPDQYTDMKQAASKIASEEGFIGLFQGASATLAGYMWYGLTVYPGYELLKRVFSSALGYEAATAFRVPLVLASGACATVVACIGVCPAEAVRIRQVSDPNMGSGGAALSAIIEQSGFSKLYEGFPPLLIRQVSFGMVKFLVFDFLSDAIYSIIPSLAAASFSQAGVSLFSGLVAGVCAAVVSQPADTVLSTMNRVGSKATVTGTTLSLIKEGGFGALYRGIGGRCLWSGAIISGQFLLYDIGRQAFHIGTEDLKIFLDVLGSTLPTT